MQLSPMHHYPHAHGGLHQPGSSPQNVSSIGGSSESLLGSAAAGPGRGESDTESDADAVGAGGGGGGLGGGGTAAAVGGGLEDRRWRVTCHLRGSEGEDKRLLTLPEVTVKKFLR